jgi:hypothetical protein
MKRQINKIHKVDWYYKRILRSYCGLLFGPSHTTNTCFNWKGVNCKNCLRNKKKFEEKK